MKLFVKNKNNSKVYLKLFAPTRRHLASLIGSNTFVLENEVYSVNNVEAESESSNTTAGAVIGGLIGLIGGPIGTITGSTIGGFIGNSSDKNDEKKVAIFNSRYL